MAKMKTCECGAEIVRMPGSRGPLANRCDACKAGAEASRKRSSRREAARRPVRRNPGEWRSVWERLRSELEWPTNVPAWALRAAGHDPRWYDVRHYPRAVVAARKYGHPMPEGFERFPGEGDEPVPGLRRGDEETDPALKPGREERKVLQEVDESLTGDEKTPGPNAGEIALPDDVETLGVVQKAPVPREGDSLPDFDGWVPVDHSKGVSGYVDRRSSRKRDLSAVARYVRHHGPEGLSDEDAEAAQRWLREHGEALDRGL